MRKKRESKAKEKQRNAKAMDIEREVAVKEAEQIPEGYHNLGEFLIGNVFFDSFRIAIDAAIALTDLFEQRHSRGDCGGSFALDSLWFEMETGKARWVRQPDAEKAADPLCVSLIRYCAPEIVTGQAEPGIYSDRHLLSVLIFLLFTGGQHPLEGRAAVSPVMTRELAQKVYGTSPCFVFEDGNRENRPVMKIHGGTMAVWDSLPSYVRNMFRRSFGEDGLNNPESRPSEQEWKDVLIRYQNGVVPCTCGNVMYDQGSNKYFCPRCGQSYTIAYQIVLPTVKIPASRGNRIYSCQMDPSAGGTDIAARIVASQKDVHKLGIQNMTNQPWSAVSTKGERRDVNPGDVIPLKEGIEFQCGETIVMIEASK